jgi:hypothetical protein
MNFTELYKKIAEMDGSGMESRRTVNDEGLGEGPEPAASPAMARVAAAKAAGTLPAAPVGLSTTNTGNVPGAQPVGGSSAAMSNPVATKTNIAPGQPLPANAGAVKGESMGDEEVEECGPMGPSGMMGMSAPKQSDSVTMNLSMNGSGPGGIRDLMSILRNIDSGGKESDSMPHPDGLELDIMGMDHPHDEPSHDEHGEEDGIVFGNDMEEEYANEPNEMYAPVDAVVNPPSNDLNRPKQMYKHSYHQGDNAMAMESLRSNLENLYKEVRSR